MLRPLIPILLLVLAGAKAQAEDFTGFDAGLNAGTGKSSEHDRDAQTSPAGLDRIDPGYDLPPSARGAAALLHRSQPAGNAPLVGR